MKVYGYMSGPASAIEQQRDMLLQYGIQEDNIFADVLDTSRDERRALNTLLGTPETLPFLHAGDLLVIPVTGSLGQNFSDTLTKWLQLKEELSVTVIMLPLPLAHLDWVAPTEYFSISEFLDVMLAKFVDLQKRQPSPRKAGRPSIPYPADWDKIYHAWKQREITSADAIKRTGLKRNTFYKMIKKYEAKN